MESLFRASLKTTSFLRSKKRGAIKYKNILQFC